VNPASTNDAEIDTDRQQEQQQRLPAAHHVKFEQAFSRRPTARATFGHHPGRRATAAISPGWELGGKGGIRDSTPGDGVRAGNLGIALVTDQTRWASKLSAGGKAAAQGAAGQTCGTDAAVKRSGLAVDCGFPPWALSAADQTSSHSSAAAARRCHLRVQTTIRAAPVGCDCRRIWRRCVNRPPADGDRMVHRLAGEMNW